LRGILNKKLLNKSPSIPLFQRGRIFHISHLLIASVLFASRLIASLIFASLLIAPLLSPLPLKKGGWEGFYLKVQGKILFKNTLREILYNIVS
jgi:hypothetical protein